MQKTNNYLSYTHAQVIQTTITMTFFLITVIKLVLYFNIVKCNQHKGECFKCLFYAL